MWDENSIKVTKYAGIRDFLEVWKAIDIKALLEASGIRKRSGAEAESIVFWCSITPLIKANSLLESWKIGKGDAYLRRFLNNFSHCSITRFLSNKSYDWRKFNLLRIEEMQSYNKLKCEKWGWIFLDDVVIEKSGKHMEGIAWVYDATKKKAVLGYILVNLIYWDGKKEYPLNFDFKLKRNDRISIAIRLVEEIAGIVETRNIAFDCLYFCLKLIKRLDDLGFIWLTKAKSNRIFIVNGRKRNAKSLIEQNYCGLAELPNYGIVKVATVKAAKEKQLLVTNDLSMQKKEMKFYYSKRFRIDNPFHKEMKQNLNLESFHTRSLASIIAHVAISFLTRSLLEAIRILSRKVMGKSLSFIIKLINTASAILRKAGRILLNLILLPRNFLSRLR